MQINRIVLGDTSERLSCKADILSHVFNTGRVILGYSVSHSTQTVAYTQNWLLFAKGRGGPVDLMWIVQTHNGSPVILVPFRKDLARMKGTPQPNQNWEAAQ